MDSDFPWLVLVANAIRVAWIREVAAPSRDDIKLSVDRSITGAAVVVLLVCTELLWAG